MSGPVGSSTWFGTPSYDLDNSLRIGSAAASGLARFGNDSRNGNTFTISFWVKRSILGTAQILVTSKTESAGVNSFVLTFTAADKIQVLGQPEDGTTGAGNNRTAVLTTAVFRDISAWYHIVYRQDTTQATAGNRHKLYVNGVLQSLATNNALDQNTEWKYFYNANNYPYAIANDERDNSYADFYMAEHHYTDGVSNGPEAFGETGPYGEWKPIVYAGSHGTYGHYLKFNQTGAGSGTTAVGGHDYTTGTSSTIGADSSGNDHHFHVQGYATHDHVPDSPTNNFATLNFLSSGGAGFFEGNLKYTSTAHTGAGTLGISSGKAYFEVTVSGASNSHIGVCNIGKGINPLRGGGWSAHGGITYKQNGDQYRLPVGGSSSTTVSYGASYTNGDIIGVAIDVDNDTIVFYKNNASQGNAAAGPSFLSSNGTYSIMIYGGSAMVFVCNFGQDSSFAGAKTAQGNTDSNGEGDFYYEPPSGFLALCTNNLPEPAVDPSNHFKALAYTGTGSGQVISGVGFKPDFLWAKRRNNDYGHVLLDIARGFGSAGNDSRLESSAPDVAGASPYVASLNADGYVTENAQQSLNIANGTYVGWHWKAGSGNTAVAESGNNPGGTHNANQAAGFSIVKYVGTGANGTVTHGLGVAPELILIKNIGVNDEWNVYYGDNTDYLVLDDTDATADAATRWNDTSPSSTVFTVSTDHSVNADGENYIAYCWRSIPGFSQIGSYAGNNDANGTFIHTGFRPAFVMNKAISRTGNWMMTDSARSPHNVNGVGIFANAVAREYSDANTNIDFVSNGFKWRTADDNNNDVNETYFYMAFAEVSFKYANAR